MDKDGAHEKKKRRAKRDTWPIKAFFLTFALATAFSLLSETTLLGVSMPVALLVLFAIICVGILFDVVGVAVAVQDVTSYTAMASKKIRGAKQAIMLVQNAGRVSNICNDVVGDICGIVSGAMGAAIIARLVTSGSGTGALLWNVGVSALIAACTVGGKAAGKRFALGYSQEIVFAVAKLLAIFEKH